MANKIVVVYLHVKINNKWTFKKARAIRRRLLSNGAYYISGYQGTRKRMERVGPDPIEAEKAQLRKTAELSFLAVGGEVKANPALSHMTALSTTLSEALALRLFQSSGGCGDAGRDASRSC